MLTIPQACPVKETFTGQGHAEVLVGGFLGGYQENKIVDIATDLKLVDLATKKEVVMKLDEHKSLGFLANFIGRHGHRYFEKKFSEYGLHHGSIFVLRQLYRKDGQRQNDLVKGMELNKANVARLLEKLQSSGYVTRKKDKSDNRVNRVYLTAKAWEIKSEFNEIFKEWTAILTQGMDIGEQKQAKRLLIKMCNNCITYFEEGEIFGTTKDIIR